MSRRTIADALRQLQDAYPDRWQIRRSGRDGGALDQDQDGRAFTCPEQTGKVDNCASCGLCWTAPSAVRFLTHGHSLAPDHPALGMSPWPIGEMDTRRRTWVNPVRSGSRYQGKLTGLDPMGERCALKPSTNSKLGKRTVTDRWPVPVGSPILTLTLEERATCPRSCKHWRDCYGNNMHAARRLAHGPRLQRAIERDLEALNGRPVLIRLHVLGDFYSVSYVDFWARMMARHPNVYVFGYTAH